MHFSLVRDLVNDALHPHLIHHISYITCLVSQQKGPEQAFFISNHDPWPIIRQNQTSTDIHPSIVCLHNVSLCQARMIHCLDTALVARNEAPLKQHLERTAVNWDFRPPNRSPWSRPKPPPGSSAPPQVEKKMLQKMSYTNNQYGFQLRLAHLEHVRKGCSCRLQIIQRFCFRTLRWQGRKKIHKQTTDPLHLEQWFYGSAELARPRATNRQTMKELWRDAKVEILQNCGRLQGHEVEFGNMAHK